MTRRHRLEFSPDELPTARALEAELDRLVASGSATLVTDSVAALPPATLLAAGYRGKVRYECYLPNSKVIMPAEQQAADAVGFPVARVWEFTAQRALLGAAAGVPDGAEANRQSTQAGRPHGFHWVVAEDPTRVAVASWPAIVAYLEAFRAQLPLGVAQIGAYGSQALVEHLLTAGVVSKGWQVGGWSTSVSQLPGMCLYQRLFPTLAQEPLRSEIDENVALQADWGQVPVKPTPAPPKPDPKPDPPTPSPSEVDTMIQFVAKSADAPEYWLVTEAGTLSQRRHIPTSGDALVLCALLGQSPATPRIVSDGYLQGLPGAPDVAPNSGT